MNIRYYRGWPHSCVRIFILLFAVTASTEARSDDPVALPALAGSVIPHEYPTSFRNLGEIVKFGRGGPAKFVPADRSVDAQVRADAEAIAKKWLQVHCPPEWAKQLTVSKIEIVESDRKIMLLTLLPTHRRIAIEQKNWVEISRGEVTYAYLQVNKIVPVKQKAPTIIKRSLAHRKLSSKLSEARRAVKFKEKELRLIYRQCAVLVDDKPRLQFLPVWIDPQDLVYANAHTGECYVND